MRVSCRYIALMVILCLACRLWAGPRAYRVMQRAAENVLCLPGLPSGTKDVKLIDERSGMTVWGGNGTFAIAAADEAYPEILAYSSTPYKTALSNPQFCWWLRAMEHALSEDDGTVRTGVKPDTGKYADHVDPLIATHWGQGHPYNMLCPYRYPTGCVTTATTQVMKYFEWPQKGEGTVFTLLPFGDYDGRRFEVALGETEYDYGKMLNEYPEHTLRTQATAVASLMYHVGLSVKSMYDASGTGAYTETLCHGLRNNMGYPFAVTLGRDSYTDGEWMDMIFASLNAGVPIIYGGSDKDYAGHEFVLDGYDSEGRVHVNWGWDGTADGYFNMSMLRVGRYNDFTCYQDMVAGCSTNCLEADTMMVTMTAPGVLADVISGRDDLKCLKVSGPVNGSDLKTIRALAGSDEHGHGTRGQLAMLDLSGASIVDGGEPYLVSNGVELTTHDDEMPFMAFSHCHRLIDVTLPDGLRSYGGAVFMDCNNLERVVLRPSEESDFVIDNGYIMTADRQQLIEYLPDGSSVTLCVIPMGVKVVREHAFSARYLYDRLLIPESVERIESFAFNRCFNLSRTYVFSDEPPAIDPTAIDELDLSLRTLFVPEGCKTKYSVAPGWSKYRGRIMEFDKANVAAHQPIQDIQHAMWHDVYDLQGRKVGQGSEHLHSGIYVVNGKLVFIK